MNAQNVGQEHFEHALYLQVINASIFSVLESLLSFYPDEQLNILEQSVE